MLMIKNSCFFLNRYFFYFFVSKFKIHLLKLDDVSLCRDYSDAASAGDSCLIQSSSQEKSVAAKNNNNITDINKMSAQVAKLKAKISKLKNSKALLKLRTRELLSEYRKKRDILKQR